MANKIVPKTRQQKATQMLSMITVWGVVIYVAIDVILTFLRHDYSWIHNAESDYGRGPYFWLMDINFILRCLLSLALVKAVRINFPNNKSMKQASIWLGLWAIASGLLAFFADNPYGYSKLRSGSIHILLAFIAFFAALVAMILFSRLVSKMKPSSKVAHSLIVLTAIVLISLVLIGHSHFRPHSLGGLYERIFLASVLVWEIILALFVRKNGRQLSTLDN